MYKCMTLISKNLSIDKVADTTNKYNNAYHSKIKMNSVDVESSTHIDFVVEKNGENPKLEVGDHVRISKYKNIFAKGYVQNWSEEVFMIKKVKNKVGGYMLLAILTGEEIVVTFYEKELQKHIKKNLG